jgi:hypothetical protein
MDCVLQILVKHSNSKRRDCKRPVWSLHYVPFAGDLDKIFEISCRGILEPTNVISSSVEEGNYTMVPNLEFTFVGVEAVAY